jgi:hypothetical protein
MSKPKQPQSGLRTMKRDFSSSSFGASSQPIDVDNDIDWPLTPPVVAPKALSGSEQRMKDIQDALAGRPPQTQSRPLSNMSSQVINKRSNPSSSDFDAPPAKRRLPNSWNDAEISMPSKQAIASRAQAAPKKTVTSASSSTAITKPAKVFLSSEQTQILKLVTEGHSVFYTGSAGEFFMFRFFLGAGTRIQSFHGRFNFKF